MNNDLQHPTQQKGKKEHTALAHTGTNQGLLEERQSVEQGETIFFLTQLLTSRTFN